MAKYAESDPRDWEVWQTVHNNWARLVNAEMDYRVGRGSDDYYELVESFGCVDTSNSEPRGSSSSRLSTMEAFERGYQGGWR
jgi:hypothetical protein